MVDSGVFAPVLTFQKLFADEGVTVTEDEVRAPMGVHKRVSNKKWKEKQFSNSLLFIILMRQAIRCPFQQKKALMMLLICRLQRPRQRPIRL